MKSGRVICHCLGRDLIIKLMHDMIEFLKAALNYQIEELYVWFYISILCTFFRLAWNGRSCC